MSMYHGWHWRQRKVRTSVRERATKLSHRIYILLNLWKESYPIGRISPPPKWQPTAVFLPREFHGQRSLEGCSPWGDRESDTTEWLTHTHTPPPNSMLATPVRIRIFMRDSLPWDPDPPPKQNTPAIQSLPYKRDNPSLSLQILLGSGKYLSFGI